MLNKSILVIGIAMAGVVVPLHAQHLHLNAGALTGTAGSQLNLANGEAFAATSGYMFHSILRTNGIANGWYEFEITFAALAISPLFGGPEPGHAAAGSRLALVVKSLDGPSGGQWAFWESAQCEDYGESITFSLLCGTSDATNAFFLSENGGEPGADPYGHCHYRRLTLDKPGLYKLGVQIVDLSSNGPGAGPVHTPSPIYEFYFQAGVTIGSLARNPNNVAIMFATRTGSTYYLEASADLTNGWVTIAGPLAGNHHLHTATDPTVNAAQRFYRLRVTTP